MTNSTPEFMNPSLAMEAFSANAAGKDAVNKLKEMASAGQKLAPAPEEVSGMRRFISPTHPNGRFLVAAGQVIWDMTRSGGSLNMRPAVSRDGDVFAVFSSGVCVSDDPTVIEWCEAHTGDPDAHKAFHDRHKTDARACGAPIGLCRENGPGVDVWAELKAGQMPTSRRPANISPEIDVDAFMRGDHLRGNKSLETGVGAAAVQAANNSAAAEVARAKGHE